MEDTKLERVKGELRNKATKKISGRLNQKQGRQMCRTELRLTSESSEQEKRRQGKREIMPNEN